MKIAAALFKPTLKLIFCSKKIGIAWIDTTKTNEGYFQANNTPDRKIPD